MNITRLRTIASLWLCGIGLTVSAIAAEPVDSSLKSLPAGCFVNRSVELPKDQVAGIGTKLGAGIKRITNNWLTVQGSAIQVNLLEGKTEADALALHKSISGMKGHPSFCLRDGKRVIEYVGKDPALAIKTSYELGFIPKPKQVRYRVAAEVATVDKADYMAFNELFNQFLAAKSRDAGQASPELVALSNRFQFGNTLTLRDPGNPPRAVYRFNPQPQAPPHSKSPDSITFSFDGLAAAFGVPYVTLTAEINVNDKGFTASTRRPEESLLSATAWWPVDTPQVKLLAGQIVSKAQTQDDKVQAILTWLAPGKNLKSGGPVTGSRWGVTKALEQKFGHCWDFADCFVTLGRASGIPCRQVAGWLYGTSGHVWAEVLIAGKGWQQVDPTGGGNMPCGIYHIPYFTSEDGEMPVLYVSMPKIDIQDSR